MRLLNVLMSPAARKIDFRLGAIKVDYIRFLTIYALVAVGDIGVDVDPDALPYGAGAKYAVHEYRYVFPNENIGPDVDNTMIHESVHVMRLIRGYWAPPAVAPPAPNVPYAPYITRVDDEAAAYVAGALYLIYAHPTFRYNAADKIQSAAYVIADSIKDRTGAVVSEQTAETLRTVILNDPNYHDIQRWTGD
jgi:hypothetical protein